MSAFKKFQGELEHKGYSKDSAGAIAASVGRKKYGSKVMAKAAKEGKSAASVAHGAATHESLADHAHKDPDAKPGDTDAHTLHGAKLLSAIASAHVSHLHGIADKKKEALRQKKLKAGTKGNTYDKDENSSGGNPMAGG